MCVCVCVQKETRRTDVSVRKYVATMECRDTLLRVYTYEQKPVLRRPRSSALGSAALHRAARAMSTTQPTTPTKLHAAHLSRPQREQSRTQRVCVLDTKHRRDDELREGAHGLPVHAVLRERDRLERAEPAHHGGCQHEPQPLGVEATWAARVVPLLLLMIPTHHRACAHRERDTKKSPTTTSVLVVPPFRVQTRTDSVRRVLCAGSGGIKEKEKKQDVL